MEGIMPQGYKCEKCGKTMKESQFYSYRDGRKAELCKKCLTMHVDNFKPDTFLWILEKLDVPYIEAEWNTLRDRAFAKGPEKMTGMSVFGRYLSKMKLLQWKKYTWADTEELAILAKKKSEQELKAKMLYEEQLQEDFENGQMSEAEYKTMLSTSIQNENYRNASMSVITAASNNPFNEINFIQEEEIDLSNDLTEEDKKYLAIKWGRSYRPNEWVELEKMYNEMTDSFDIQDADTINTLIVICKTNLKMNQAIDMGDLDGFQKLSKVYESLRKSAKFTAAQNKEEKSEFVDSVGELVAYCEKVSGVIPKYELKVEYDIVDKVINDLKGYNKSLITEDKALAKQIEDYLKKREYAEQKKRDEQQAKEQGFEEVQIEDKDYEEYFNQIQDEKEQDNIDIGDDE